MKNFLFHLLLPRESNNQRAGLLHHKSLIFIIILLFVGSLGFSFLRISFPSVLGISTDATSEKLLLLTNKAREENGLAPLVLNPELSLAASNKAKNMLEENYWAHNSPKGVTPWVFIKNTGYNYVYAGENLARGFASAEDAINAWMASKTHRENILSTNYKDVGFAVAIGKLNNEETVLIVEELGNKTSEIAIKNSTRDNISTSANVGGLVASAVSQPLINSLSLSYNLDKTILILFVMVLLLDMIAVERKKIVRLVGHNIDHIFFLLLILLLISILSKGVIV